MHLHRRPTRSLRAFALCALLAALVAAIVAGPARADTPIPTDFAPSIWSDKPDYSPGEQVDLSGASWQPGESVHITVNDDAGSSWTHDADVNADEAGNIADRFSLPAWFIAKYNVRATGASGAVATTSFTDGNVKVTGSPNGVSFALTKTIYTDSGSCSSTGTTTGPTSVTSDNIGLGNNTQSVKLVAAAVSDSGGAFQSWTSSDGPVIGQSRAICVQGFQTGNQSGFSGNGAQGTGNQSYTANYASTPVNHAPSGADKTVTTGEDNAYTFTSGDFGFSDPSDTPANTLLAVKVSSLPAAGTLRDNGAAVAANQSIPVADITASKLTYSPALNGNGSPYTTFTFQVQDNGGAANGGVDLDPTPNTITVNVTPANDAPSAAGTAASTNEDTALGIDLSTLVSDVETAKANLTYSIVTAPVHGSLGGSGAGTTYTPDANYNGADSFAYKVTDRGDPDNCVAGPGCSAPQSSAIQIVSITVNPVNDAPTATDANVSTNEDSTKAIDLGALTGDQETSAANLTYTIVAGPAHGSLSGSGASRSYAPGANFSGSDSFTFKVTDRGDPDNCTGTAPACDGVKSSATKTVSITVNPVNDVPSAADTAVSTDEDTAKAVDLSALVSDIETTSPANLAYAIATAPAHGSLSGSGASRTYTPDANFNGQDSFTYKVTDRGDPDNCTGTPPACDGARTSATRTVSITVSPVNDTPTAADSTATTNEDSPKAISLGALVSDQETSAADLTYAIVAAPAHGSLSGSGVSRTYTPASNYNGSDSFTYKVTDRGDPDNCTGTTPACDGAKSSATRTVSITVNPVNDAPAGADKTVSTLEDHAYTLGTDDFGFTDANDSPPAAFASIKVTSLPARGELQLDGAGVAADAIVTAADIHDGKLKFVPAANANGSGYADVKFVVRDDGGTDNGGANVAQAANTITVDVTSVDDAPAGANTTVSTLEDHAYELMPADFGFSDPGDSPANSFDAVQVTSLPTHGRLELAGTELTAPATVSTADIAAHRLSFVPGADANGSGYASFDFKVVDDGGIANGGVDTDPSANTITVDVTPVNDAPSGADRAVSTLEDTAYTVTSADLGFSDGGDSPANRLASVTITAAPSHGSLTLSGGDVSAGDEVSAADIHDGKLKFVPVGNANGSAYAHFAFQVRDDGGTANGGVDLDPSANTITVDVTSVNDAPSGAGKTVGTLEDHSYTLDSGDFGFSDSSDDPADAFLAVRVVSLPGAGALTLDGDPVHTDDVVSVGAIDAGRLRFTPADNANGAGYAGFKFRVQDDGGTDNGGLDLAASASTLTIDVTSVNDAPQGTDHTVTTNEDTAHTFAAAEFGFSDPNDVPPDELAAVVVTSLPGHGLLALDGVGVALDSSVSVADINDGKLKFVPSPNDNGAGYASFNYRVRDDGGTDNGGVDGATASSTITVDVRSINDAPRGNDNTVTTDEDTAYVLAAADFGFSDPSDTPSDALAAVQVTSLPGAGELTLNGVPVAEGDSVSRDDIAAGKLQFAPAANANGAAYARFAFQVRDDGGTANGGVDLDPSANTITVDVTSVNDAPSGADKTVSTLEDHSYTLHAGDFGFSDDHDHPANALLAVKVTSLPDAGALTLDGSPVQTGDFVSAAAIDAGQLKFTPGADDNGAGYAGVKFRVQDDGGTEHGGVDLAAVSSTVTVDVASVNDAPSGADKTVSTLEDHPYTFGAGDFGFTDPNDVPPNELAEVKVASLPAAGALTLDGNPVHTGDAVSAAAIDAGQLKFTPVDNASGSGYASFEFRVQDDGGTAHDGVDLATDANSLTVDVTSVNDAPSSTDNTITTDEDSAHTFAAGDVGFSDANDHPANALLAVRVVSLPAAGALTLDGSPVHADQFVSAAAIGAGQLKFTPGADDNGAGYASFKFRVRDDGGTEHGGVDESTAASTITVDVTPGNDRPTADASPAGLNIDEDSGASTVRLSGTDVETEASDLAFVVTRAPEHGELAHGTTTLHGGDTFTGSPQDVTYTPAADYNGTDGVSFKVIDTGDPAGCDATGPFCAAARDSATIDVPITVNSVNDAPSTADHTAATDEDNAYTFETSDFAFSDSHDSPPNGLAFVHVSTLPAGGTLADDGTALAAGDDVPAADIAHGRVTFTPTADASGSPYTAFQFRVRDDGGLARSGHDLSDPNTMTVDVNSVNDAPQGADNTVGTLEDTPYTFAASDFGFSDSHDHPADHLAAVTIATTPADGALRLNGTAVVAGASVTQTDLAAGNLTFTPAADANGSHYAHFDFKVQDDGGTTHNGADTDPSANTITVDVTSVNDAPAGHDNTVTTNEDVAYTFATSDFGLTDGRDVPPNGLLAVKVTSLPGPGRLSLDGNAVASNDFVAASDIAAGKLKFVPAADANGMSYATFAFDVRDDGGTAHGGADLAADPNSMTVDVTSVNDAPSGADKTVSTLEDHAYTFAAGDFGFSDPNDHPADALLAVKITSLPAAGDLTLDGIPVHTGDFVSASAIDAGKLKFAPAGNDNGAGYAGFRFRVQDDGGVARGGVDLAAASSTLTIDVTSVNDAPSGASRTVSTNEDTAFAFGASDFGFTDGNDSPPNALDSVKVVTLPSPGSLTLGGAAVHAGDWVSAADLGAGMLKFAPASNANGVGYASFDFQVKDSGGTANDGVDIDQSPNTVTVNVTPVNDKPTAGASPSTPGVDEDSSVPVSLSGADAETADGNLTITITQLPASGSLTQGGTTLHTGDTLSGSPQAVTYRPNADYNGSDGFKFKVGDRGDPDGCSGAPSATCDSASSSDVATVPLTVNPVNDAPVLHAAGSPSLSAIVAQDYGNSGISVTSLVASGGSSYIADVDSQGAAQGIAIKAADATNGAWQFSTNGGSSWSVLGTVSADHARLLAATSTTRVRFVPSAGFTGTVDPGITFRAWDTTSGSNGDFGDTTVNGGTTAFSVDTDTASIVVAKRSTGTSVSCSPASVVAGQATTCTAVATDDEPNGTPEHPAGSVMLTSSAGTSGTFSAASGSAFTAPSKCTLASDGAASPKTSSCKITYTPSDAASTSHAITGNFGGSSLHKSSGSAAFAVTVGRRATQTGVVCGNPVALGATVTCTATVTDTDPNGTKSNPGGAATFTTDSTTGSFTGNPCTLAPVIGSSTTSKCTVTYKSTTVGVDNIHAAYGASSVHQPSSSQAAGSSGGLAVTYDPNAGFVTGGGMISSPAGAYVADPTLTGQANFGFVSKYQKGQSAPTGQTEFQFQAAKFNFHSELYDWLVVSGSKAQYKGTGTVNGSAGFSFMITAVDGDLVGGQATDKFRMKVWNTASGAVVYDNKLGATDVFADAPTQDIAGGSIVIHSK